MKQRRPGRPARRVLAREAILEAALRLLERRGLQQLTLRAVGRELGVDAMAIYHYFADKDALLRAAAALAYGRLDPRAGTTGSWQRRLDSLAIAYVEMLGRSGELLRYLTAGPEAGDVPEVVEPFEARFRAATAPLALPPRHYRAAHYTFVDFLHGFSLAVSGGTLTPRLRHTLRAELAILYAGIASRAGGTSRRSARRLRDRSS